MTDLEARYRRLFAAYPVAHRGQREDEMVAVLLDIAEPGQHRPSRREAASIVGNGLACRARSAQEWRLGLRLAGLASVGLTTALATLILGIALLPPIEGPSWTSTPGWVPVAVWTVALAATLAAPWATTPRWRLPFTVMLGAFGLATVWLGADVLGAMRPLTVPFALSAVLVAGASGAAARARAAASLGGVVLGGFLMWRFLDQFDSVGWGPNDRVRLWTEYDRWALGYDAAGFRPVHWWIVVALGLTAGIVRPRFAIATGVLALPLAVLAKTRYRFGRADLPFQITSSLGAMVVLFTVALVVGRLRRWWTLSPTDAPPPARG